MTIADQRATQKLLTAAINILKVVTAFSKKEENVVTGAISAMGIVTIAESMGIV